MSLIFYTWLWHVVAFLPLVTAFPPSVFFAAAVWVFTAWVWPATALKGKPQ